MPLQKSTPKWVTFNSSQDVLGILSGKFTHSKDYKVLASTVKEGHTSYQIVNDLGVEMQVGTSWFEWPEDEIKPIQVDVHLTPKVHTVEINGTFTFEDEDDSFEGLTQIRELQEGDYFLKSELSQEQREFLQEHLPTYNSDTFLNGHPSITRYTVDEGEFLSCGEVSSKCFKNKLKFNDIFDYKEVTSFDNLEYQESDLKYETYYILKRKLSEDQFNFIKDNYSSKGRWTSNHLDDSENSIVLVGYENSRAWFTYHQTPEELNSDTELSFNDIFKPKGE